MSQIESEIDRFLPAGRFRSLPLDCGEDVAPGVDEVEEWQDFSHRETTNDQLRIEDIIVNLRLGSGGSLLHVGIGNSGLAVRLQSQFRGISGITIQPAEMALAQ